MSPVQKRTWLAHHEAPALGHCNVQRVLRLNGALDVARLERSLNALVRRHESLRTSFPADGATQVVHRTASLELPTTDLSRLDPGDAEAVVRRLALEDARRPFDLARAPLLRARVLRLHDDEHVLLFAVHNIVCDGWSLGLLFRDLAAAYGQGRDDHIAHPAPPIQYVDYSEWLRRRQDDPAAARSLAYWKRRLAGAPLSPGWPAVPDAAANDRDGGRCVACLAARLADAIVASARRARVTPFTIHLAAFIALLRRSSGRDDLLVGTPVAGREFEETRSVVGPFADVLVLRVDLAGHPSFIELLRRTHTTIVEAIEHQAVPFQRLVEALDPGALPGGHPFFDVLINYTGDRQRIPPRWGELAVETVDVGVALSRFPLMLYLRDDARFALELVHRTAALSDARARAFLDDYQRLLERACAEPHRTIDDLARAPPAASG